MTESCNNRINWIDITKGLVMILTVYSHCGLSLIPILGTWVYGFYMPLFFFISGIFAKFREIYFVIIPETKMANIV